MTSRILALVGLLAVATCSAPGFAQLPAAPAAAEDSAASRRADDLVRRGIELGRKDQWVEAEALFREAWGIKHSYDIAGNLGIAEATLGKLRDAAEHMTYALRTFPANGKAEHRQLIVDKLASVRPQLGTITIRVAVEKADVSIDGKRVGISPLSDAVFLEPGSHVVEATLVGYEDARLDVEVAKGATQEVALKLPKKADVPGSAGPNKVVLIVGGATAGTALVTGIVLLAEGAAKRGDARETSDAIKKVGDSCAAKALNHSSRCAQLNDTARTAGTLHNAGVGMLIGAGALATGTLVYALWPASKPSQSAVRVVPVGSATSGGVVFSGSF